VRVVTHYKLFSESIIILCSDSSIEKRWDKSEHDN